MMGKLKVRDLQLALEDECSEKNDEGKEEVSYSRINKSLTFVG